MRRCLVLEDARLALEPVDRGIQVRGLPGRLQDQWENCPLALLLAWNLDCRNGDHIRHCPLHAVPYYQDFPLVVFFDWRSLLRAGFDEALLLDPSGSVAEGTGENIFVVRNGIISTPPLEMVLNGLTRDSIITLGRSIGYEIVEEKISRDQLYTADEVFVTGTAAEIVALREIDYRTIGEGSMGPVCAKLQKLYHQAVRGELEGFESWLDYVHV